MWIAFIKKPKGGIALMKRWEYVELERARLTAEDLNIAGAQGWELVNFQVYEVPGVMGNKIKVSAVFKRELVNQNLNQ